VSRVEQMIGEEREMDLVVALIGCDTSCRCGANISVKRSIEYIGCNNE
jgi:hypothetical protein